MCDKHRRFDANQDRAARQFDQAVMIANKRAPSRGRQRIVRHIGNIFRNGVWFVQDAPAPSAPTTEDGQA